MFIFISKVKQLRNQEVKNRFYYNKGKSYKLWGKLQMKIKESMMIKWQLVFKILKQNIKGGKTNILIYLEKTY